MNKNETQFWIDYKGNTKFAETSPETIVKVILEEIQAKIGFTFRHGTLAFPLNVECRSDSGDEIIILHPDFTVSMPRSYNSGQLEKAIEVDGVYHFTRWQEKKRRWRDSLLLKQGFDIIHIDARLAYLKSHRPYLKAELIKKLVRGSPVEMINY